MVLLGEFLEIDEATQKIFKTPEINLSPLDFKLYETLGYHIVREDLTNAFIFGDLSGENGWYAQLIAAEKLAEYGVIDANRFLGIFTTYEPPSSYGIWERVSAIQRLDKALASSDSTKEVELALRNAWQLFRFTANSSIFAEIFTPRLLETKLTPNSEIMAIKIGMLSSNYNT